MAKPDTSPFAKLISHAKEYGFVFPSSEIYDGLAAVYDYGPYGVQLKNNLKQAWWQAMTRLHGNIVGLDAAIFMHPETWKASGHVDSFNDPLIDNKDSKRRYRADVLLEEHAANLVTAGQQEHGEKVLKGLARAMEDNDLQAIYDLIKEEGITCEVCGTDNWTEVRQFNLMFSSQMGAAAEGSSTVYLRPETAQGIFVNFLNVQKSARMKVPFGIAQIGKAFRNEIVARQFIFRMREFEQMEMQFFVRPGTEMEWFENWKANRLAWHKALGIPEGQLRIHQHDKLAHYANAAVDIEYEFPFGFKEVEGIHSRTDFDLSQHQKHSGKKIQYFDPEVNESYVPYVVETSIGADRLFLMVLANSFRQETDENGKERTWLALHPALAPVKAAILPLVKKDGLPEKAQEIVNSLRLDLEVKYEDAASIGKRYTRQDLIGTPFCVAVDHQSLEDDSVTVRYRDSTEQTRIAISDLKGWLMDRCSLASLFASL